MFALSACGATLVGENYQFCDFQTISFSGENHCKFETGVVFFGEQVKTASGVRTWEECSALCSEEIACAFWSHHLYRSDCTIWSSDVTRSENEHSKDWVSGKRCK